MFRSFVGPNFWRVPLFVLDRSFRFVEFSRETFGCVVELFHVSPVCCCVLPALLQLLDLLQSFLSFFFIILCFSSLWVSLKSPWAFAVAAIVLSLFTAAFFIIPKKLSAKSYSDKDYILFLSGFEN